MEEKINAIVLLTISAVALCIAHYIKSDPRRIEFRKLAKQLNLKYMGNLFGAGLDSPLLCDFRNIFPPKSVHWTQVMMGTILNHPRKCVEFGRVQHVLSGRVHGRDVHIFDYIDHGIPVSCIFLSKVSMDNTYLRDAAKFPRLLDIDREELRGLKLEINNKAMVIYGDNALEADHLARVLYAALHL